ncbi:hypothetical protein E2C01_029578 [Portunus trituberculatus]|uniref:Uncharacterized protein n=1 Tax=Portunus trituberculatus TaxID=210409 RepID=A0A5B7ENS2_PORTR|nr:hypothetical protein [Portunus trituberculatus]
MSGSLTVSKRNVQNHGKCEGGSAVWRTVARLDQDEGESQQRWKSVDVSPQVVFLVLTSL